MQVDAAGVESAACPAHQAELELYLRKIKAPGSHVHGTRANQRRAANAAGQADAGVTQVANSARPVPSARPRHVGAVTWQLMVRPYAMA